jgi:hypothetical protein
MNPAVGLLLVGACRHYLWPHFPAELQGMASKGLGAAAVLYLLAVVWRLAPSRPLAWVLLWWAWEELQVLICSAAYMVEPWHVEVGEGICSARFGFDIGAAGIMFVALLAYRLTLLDLTGSKQAK